MNCSERFLLNFFLLLFLPIAGIAQSNLAEANALLDAEQIQYRNFLNQFKGEEGIRIRLREFAYYTTDSLQAAFSERKEEKPHDRLNSIISLRYFLQTLRGSLVQNQYDVYDVPYVLEKFPQIAHNIVNGESLQEIMAGFGAKRTQLMADAFRLYPVGKRLQQLADVRRVAVSLENLISFLEKRPAFPYMDTALVYIAERSPLAIVQYINQQTTPLADHIRNSSNPLLRELVTIAGNRNVGELAHFATGLINGKYTVDELLLLRSSNVNGYYQKLVDDIQEIRKNRHPGSSLGMQPALRTALHDKAMAFYIKPINDLHESGNTTRFASIQPLRNIDLYYLITTGEDELYTSSFLGIYKQLMLQLPAGRADSLFEYVAFDQFRKFIRICSHYNVLADFLSNMPEEERKNLLSRFVSGIESGMESGIEEAMDVADAFISLSSDSLANEVVGDLLEKNLQRCRATDNFYGIRLYSILGQIYQVANHAESRQELFSRLGNYELLPVKSIVGVDNIIHQLVLFYGDEDGKASYANFLSLFKDSSVWMISKMPKWVEICSKNSVQPVHIYANLPLDHTFREDEKAQQQLLSYLSNQQIRPGVIIHRGHSYHLPTTLSYLQSYMKLAILGSCGGYKNLLTVAGKSPNAQIVATKQIGSKLINDPMIQELNALFLQEQDIFWPELWNRLAEQFNKSEATKNLFSEYVPPYRNLSLFVIRLFNEDAAVL
ncbi:hypothetical protein [Flavihumibacter sp. CACIAM 22H1]|uniref:hypothetical protein n=1 Tax=Flavihumibacter sp. CACIAM 22H1 TaxID=1812911 RepID=UPI0007A8B798|nr:hypothetical protein [Flavihumibacter sp. CACIAM 22H1]KYP15627.1 MAG: hypothetical protein A1D16_10695 [Flavihumibacter sp. CACIAM 22H1]